MYIIIVKKKQKKPLYILNETLSMKIKDFNHIYVCVCNGTKIENLRIVYKWELWTILSVQSIESKRKLKKKMRETFI